MEREGGREGGRKGVREREEEREERGRERRREREEERERERRGVEREGDRERHLSLSLACSKRPDAGEHSLSWLRDQGCRGGGSEDCPTLPPPPSPRPNLLPCALPVSASFCLSRSRFSASRLTRRERRRPCFAPSVGACVGPAPLAVSGAASTLPPVAPGYGSGPRRGHHGPGPAGCDQDRPRPLTGSKGRSRQPKESE